MTGLPPIDVEERPEKLALTVPTELKAAIEQFGEYFADTSGRTPLSLNAVVVGILTGYLDGHTGYIKWLRSQPRDVASSTSVKSSA